MRIGLTGIFPAILVNMLIARTSLEQNDRLLMRRDTMTGVEAIHARFQTYAYDMHAHDDEWLVGVTHECDHPAGVRGLPPALAPLAGRWQASGALVWRNRQLQGSELALKSGPLGSRLGFSWVPATGAWAVRAVGDVRGWAVPLLGSSDIGFTADLKPGLVGHGDIRLVAARPPAGALTRLTGGGITVSGRLDLKPGLDVGISGLALASPQLMAGGTAGWQGGRLALAITGRSRDLGAFRIDGGGPLAALALAVRLPAPGYGLGDVLARLTRDGARWQLAATADTPAGPADLAAAIGLDPVLRLDVGRLALAGLNGGRGAAP